MPVSADQNLNAIGRFHPKLQDADCHRPEKNVHTFSRIGSLHKDGAE
jgi:hypothetical protein